MRNERYERYLLNNKWWFASTQDMEVWAESQPHRLKRLWELVPTLKQKDSFGKYISTFAYGFVPITWTTEDLPQVFRLDFLVNGLALFSLAPDYQI
jgi:hypothetical protein